MVCIDVRNDSIIMVHGSRNVLQIIQGIGSVRKTYHVCPKIKSNYNSFDSVILNSLSGYHLGQRPKVSKGITTFTEVIQ